MQMQELSRTANQRNLTHLLKVFKNKERRIGILLAAANFGVIDDKQYTSLYKQVNDKKPNLTVPKGR
jgi:hypothetical protein